MASSGERRMLFDTRGRRRHVIRVVYAILALLMGGSLFLVVGPFNLGELVGSSGSGNSAAAVLDEQAERIERQLAKNPNDEQLLLALTRTRISAGNAQIEVSPEGTAQPIPAPAREDFQAAGESWHRYLKLVGDEPNVPAAQLVAGTFFRLAETGSLTIEDIESNVSEAAAAQRIVAAQQPSLGSFSSLAIYEYFSGNFAAGDKASKQASAQAPTKAEAKNIDKQLAEYRKRAKRFTTQLEKVSKAQNEANKEQLQNPFGLGAPEGSLGE